MTKRELSQLYWLNREIEANQRRLAELEAAATSSTARITGLPRLSGVTDKTAIAAEIADVRRLLQDQTDRAVAEYHRLIRYITGVQDSLMRQILSLRYINGLSWVQIAHSIGGNTEDSVRKAHDRFLGGRR